MFGLQGDTEWEGQFHECWKPGDRVWAHPDEAPWGQHADHAPWHAVPKADCADFNRKRRCFVLIHQGNELNSPSPTEVHKAKGIKTLLALGLFFKQVTEFPGPQWMAKLATVSHRHSPPPRGIEGEGKKKRSPGGLLCLGCVSVLLEEWLINLSLTY